MGQRETLAIVIDTILSTALLIVILEFCISYYKRMKNIKSSKYF